MIINHNELHELHQELAGADIALRFGVYDILHTGHQAGLDYAGSMADFLVVGVMPDEYVTRVKGPERPINPEQHRIAAIDAAEIIDYSFIAPSNALGILGTIRALRPSIYIEGSEHSQRSRRIKSGILRLMGVRYMVDEYDQHGSSSLMITCFGREGALNHSSLNFSFRQHAGDCCATEINGN